MNVKAEYADRIEVFETPFPEAGVWHALKAGVAVGQAALSVFECRRDRDEYGKAVVDEDAVFTVLLMSARGLGGEEPTIESVCRAAGQFLGLRSLKVDGSSVWSAKGDEDDAVDEDELRDRVGRAVDKVLDGVLG